MLLRAENVTEARRSGLASTTRPAAYLFAVYHRPDQRSAEPWLFVLRADKEAHESSKEGQEASR